MSEKLPFCACGECGLRVTKEGNRFIHGHNGRGKERPLEIRIKISKGNKGKPKSSDHRAALSDSFLREKNPLPKGQEKSIPGNKNCASYLSNVVEELLARTYKDVKRMPNNNPGYDLICDRNFKIDVKSSTMGFRGYWTFGIRKNTVPDYFVCLAFEDRKSFILTHSWLIPGNVVNHLKGLTIRKSTITKWQQYEQPIDKARECCNEMRGCV